MLETVLADLRLDAVEPEAKPLPAYARPLEPTIRELAASPFPNVEPPR